MHRFVSSTIHSFLICLAAITSLSVGSHVCAMQVTDEVTPAEQVKAVEEAIEKSDLHGSSSTKAQADYVVRGRFVAPAGSKIVEGRGGIVSRSKNSSTTSSFQVNADGTFTKSVRGPSTLFISPQLEGFSQRSFGPFELADGPLNVGDILLDTGFNARILVQNEKGEPLGEVKIESVTKWLSVRGRKMGQAGPPIKGATSTQEGVIELQRMTEEPITISLLRPGYEYSRRELTLERDATIDWKLIPAKPVTGRFVDDRGKAVSGVELHLARRDGDIARSEDPRGDFLNHLAGNSRYLTPIAVSDENGEFEIESLRSDIRYWFMALHQNYRPTIIEQVTAGSVLAPTKLLAPLVVKGKVIGDLSQLSVRSNQRYLTYRNLLNTGEGNYDAGFDCQVDEQGRFQITQLLAGEVKLQAADQTLRIAVSESVDNVVFDLQNPKPPPSNGYRPIRIVLKPTAGQPIRGEVLLSWRLPNSSKAGQRSAYKQLPASESMEWEAPAGASVHFRGSKLVGSYAENQSLGTVPEGKEPHEFTVSVDPAGLVSGQVVDHEGEVVKDFRIDVDRNTGRTHVFQVHGTHIHHPQGRFALGPLPLGNEHQYRAYVQIADSWRLAVSDRFHVTLGAPVFDEIIRVPPMIHLSGRVLNAYGEPAPGTPLSLTWNHDRTSRSVGAQQRTDRDGRFRIAISANSLEGKFSFSIHPFERSTGQTIPFLADEFADDKDFGDIRLQASSAIRGFVVAEDGTPQKDVTINLTPLDMDNASFRASRSGRTDANGLFEIDGIERIPQRLYLFGKKLVDATSPFAISEDEFGNQLWLVEPFESESDVTIIVK